MSVFKDSLNLVLEKKNLSVCTVIHELNEIENKSRKDADKKYPDFGIKHSDYEYNLIEIRTNKYCKKNKINEKLLNGIMAFVMECTEDERRERIRILKAKKAQRVDNKECIDIACSVLEDRVKKKMNNPNTFEFVSCTVLSQNGNTAKLKYTFRGSNKFNAIIIDSMIAEISFDGCKLISFN